MSVPFTDDRDSGAAHRTWTLTFAAATTSDPFNFERFKVMLIHLPSGWVGTSITFQVAEKYDGTYKVLNDDAGNQISITVAASKGVPITDAVKALAIASCGWMKIVSDQTETATVYVEGTP